MVVCCAVGCTNRSDDTEKGLTFHMFPENESLRLAWILALRRKNFQPNLCSALCSEHFMPDQIQEQNGCFELIADAIPTVFRSHTLSKNFIKYVQEELLTQLSDNEENSGSTMEGVPIKRPTLISNSQEDTHDPSMSKEESKNKTINIIAGSSALLNEKTDKILKTSEGITMLNKRKCSEANRMDFSNADTNWESEDSDSSFQDVLADNENIDSETVDPYPQLRIIPASVLEKVSVDAIRDKDPDLVNAYNALQEYKRSMAEQNIVCTTLPFVLIKPSTDKQAEFAAAQVIDRNKRRIENYIRQMEDLEELNKRQEAKIAVLRRKIEMLKDEAVIYDSRVVRRKDIKKRLREDS